YCETQHAFEAGLTYGEQILQHDRGRERIHRQMMRLHNAAGNRSGAIRQYGRCVAALQEELGVQPDRRTRALLDQIRIDAPDVLDAANTSDDDQFGPNDSLSSLLERFRQLRATVIEIQSQLSRGISVLERVAAEPPRP